MKRSNLARRGAPARRAFLRAVSLASGAAVVTACSPGTAQPPASSGTAPAPSRAAWEDDWDRLAAAAKQEGKLVVASYHGVNVFRKVLSAFEQAFPGIVVDHQHAPSSSLFIPKITQERQAGMYGFDILSGGAQQPSH